MLVLLSPVLHPKHNLRCLNISRKPLRCLYTSPARSSLANVTLAKAPGETRLYGPGNNITVSDVTAMASQVLADHVSGPRPAAHDSGVRKTLIMAGRRFHFVLPLLSPLPALPQAGSNSTPKRVRAEWETSLLMMTRPTESP